VTVTARFDPAGPLRGDYTPPADKSISHRAALFAGMCDEPVTVDNYLDSEDTRSTLNAVRTLGAGVEEDPDGRLVIRGVGLHAPLEATGGLLNVGNAGTLMRLLPGWLAGQPGGVWTLDGDDSIRRRPVDRVAEPLRLMGAGVEAREGRFPPFTVRGAPLTGIDYELPVASAQVKSCVLIAGMFASGSTTVHERAPSRDHTERLLRRARVPFEQDGGRLTVSQSTSSSSTGCSCRATPRRLPSSWRRPSSWAARAWSWRASGSTGREPASSGSPSGWAP
jgi:3-phosphoshikimate 1-carboxyvinyltransferase